MAERVIENWIYNPATKVWDHIFGNAEWSLVRNRPSIDTVDSMTTITGSAKTTGAFTVGSSLSVTTSANVKGNLSVTGSVTASKVTNAVWNDYAEWFECSKPSELSEGDLVCYDPELNTHVKSSLELAKSVVGVVSRSYGHIMGGPEGRSEDENWTDHVAIGLAGRIPVKVKGEVRTGDLLTVSDTPGVAISCINASDHLGTIVGKALYEIPNRNGMWMMLIMMM